MRAAPSSAGTHQIRDEDLSAARLVTQPRGLDDRVAKVVVTLLCRLPGAEPHPKGERPCNFGIVSIHCLLHRHRAGNGGGSGRKDDHEAVPQILDLVATGSRDRLTKGGEVPAAQIVGRLGREGRSQLRRANQVGEEHRDALGCSHLPPFRFRQSLGQRCVLPQRTF